MIISILYIFANDLIVKLFFGENYISATNYILPQVFLSLQYVIFHLTAMEQIKNGMTQKLNNVFIITTIITSFASFMLFNGTNYNIIIGILLLGVSVTTILIKKLSLKKFLLFRYLTLNLLNYLSWIIFGKIGLLRIISIELILTIITINPRDVRYFLDELREG